MVKIIGEAITTRGEVVVLSEEKKIFGNIPVSSSLLSCVGGEASEAVSSAEPRLSETPSRPEEAEQPEKPDAVAEPAQEQPEDQQARLARAEQLAR
eukprot:10943042-Heterocapsa_arctica.AAC.1